MCRTCFSLGTVGLLVVLWIGLCFTTVQGAEVTVAVRDGVAICVFGPSGREYKVGKVNNDQVGLFATYGGVPIAIEDLKQAVSTISTTEAKAKSKLPNDEQRLLLNALLTPQLVGIWILEKASVDGKPEPVTPDDPSYLVVRADKTFQIIKKGQKPVGKWEFDSKGQFVMKTSKKTMSSQVRRQPGDRLELEFIEDGSKVLAQYSRTNLTKEPKAVDQ
jgi:hypothetical protein